MKSKAFNFVPTFLRTKKKRKKKDGLNDDDYWPLDLFFASS